MLEQAMPSWHNPTTWELRQFLYRNNLPIGRHFNLHLEQSESLESINGNAFTQTSDFLINVGTNPNFHYTIYNEIFNSIDLEHLRIPTSQADTSQLSNAARLLYNLYSNIISPVASDSIPTFNPGHSYNFTWNICMDAESVFTSSLPGWTSKLDYKQHLVNPNHISYFHNDTPVIYQKIGNQVVYKEHRKGVVTSTATGINLTPIIVKGMLLPAGTLLGIHNPRQPIYNSTDWYKNHHFDLTDITSIVPLRLTFFALNPNNASATFGKDYTKYRQEFQGAATLQDFITNA